MRTSLFKRWTGCLLTAALAAPVQAWTGLSARAPAAMPSIFSEEAVVQPLVQAPSQTPEAVRESAALHRDESELGKPRQRRGNARTRGPGDSGAPALSNAFADSLTAKESWDKRITQQLNDLERRVRKAGLLDPGLGADVRRPVNIELIVQNLETTYLLAKIERQRLRPETIRAYEALLQHGGFSSDDWYLISNMFATVAQSRPDLCTARTLEALAYALAVKDLKDQPARNLLEAWLSIVRAAPSLNATPTAVDLKKIPRYGFSDVTKLLFFEVVVNQDGLRRLDPGSPARIALDSDFYMKMGDIIESVAAEKNLITSDIGQDLELVLRHGHFEPNQAPLAKIALALGAIAHETYLPTEFTLATVLHLMNDPSLESDLYAGKIYKGLFKTLHGIVEIRTADNFYPLLPRIAQTFLAKGAAGAGADVMLAIVLSQKKPVPNSVFRGLSKALTRSLKIDDEKAVLHAIAALAIPYAARFPAAVRDRIEQTLMHESLPLDVAKSATMALRAFNHTEPGKEGSLSALINEMPMPQHSAPVWPHFWVYRNSHFQTYTPRDSPVGRFSIAQAVHRLLLQYRPDLINRPKDPQVARTIDFIRGKRAALSTRLIYGPDVHAINLLHREMDADRNEIEAYQRAKENMASIQTYAGPGDKERALYAVANSRGPLVIYFDGHGGPNHLWLDEGNPGHEISDAMRRSDAISYVELAEALQTLSRSVDLERVTILLDSCYSANFAVHLKDKLAELHVTTQPMIDASSNFDLPSYYNRHEPNSSFFFKGLTKQDYGARVYASQLLRAEEHAFGSQDATLFVPIDEKELVDLFGSVAYQRSKTRFGQQLALALNNPIYTAMSGPSVPAPRPWVAALWRKVQVQVGSVVPLLHISKRVFFMVLTVALGIALLEAMTRTWKSHIPRASSQGLRSPMLLDA